MARIYANLSANQHFDLGNLLPSYFEIIPAVLWHHITHCANKKSIKLKLTCVRPDRISGICDIRAQKNSPQYYDSLRFSHRKSLHIYFFSCSGTHLNRNESNFYRKKTHKAFVCNIKLAVPYKSYKNRPYKSSR